MKTPIAMFLAAVALASLPGTFGFARGDAPPGIKEIMNEAHRGGLLKTIANGQGTEAEKARLLVLYRALAANTPPQGTAESWQSKTAALVRAAQAAVADDPDAGRMLQTAGNCMACHDAHKP